jgi:ribosomal protein L21
LNVHYGGKQPKMRDTSFVPVEQRYLPHDQQEQVAQTMVFADDHPRHSGKPKGMLAVARERGLVKTGKAPV